MAIGQWQLEHAIDRMRLLEVAAHELETEL
jgi:hypothetical protein